MRLPAAFFSPSPIFANPLERGSAAMRGWRGVFAACGVSARLLFGLGALAAQPVPSPAAVTPDAAALAPFIDGLMAAHLAQYKIPGAVVAIVQDGQVVLTKGYGHADIARGTPVDPATSLFRIASTTKLFTWVAVMQLVEQGRLDLDADVNRYLTTFKLPPTYAEPVTLRHLMTHTAGFDRGGVGYEISTDLTREKSIADVLQAHLPARVRPPGAISAYSNYGAALAGLIVENVSGLPYDDYIQQNIFDRLAMRHATTREPLPAAFSNDRVVGYAREGGVFVEPVVKTYEGGFRPAGSATVSALDMARFMIAQLPGAAEPALLKPATLARMQAPAFVLDPRLPGMGLGYFEEIIAGEPVVSHGGADPLFNTGLYLLPARRLGIFVSYSGGTGDAAAAGLVQAVLARLYPKPSGPPRRVDTGALSRYAGAYRFTLNSQQHVDRFYGLLAQLTVSVAGDRLRIGSGEDEAQFTPVGPHLFQKDDDTQRIAFRVDASRQATHLFIDALPAMPLERTPFSDRANVWWALLAGAILVMVSALLAAPWQLRGLRNDTSRARQAAHASLAVAAWGLLSLATVVLVLMNTGLVARLSGIPLSWRFALLMPVAFIGVTGLFTVVLLRAWTGGHGRPAARVHQTLVALAAVVLCLFFVHWNLVGWNFG